MGYRRRIQHQAWKKEGWVKKQRERERESEGQETGKEKDKKQGKRKTRGGRREHEKGKHMKEKDL